MSYSLKARGRSLSRRGFTFIEIMVVVLIIGVLAAITVPKFAGRISNARRTATMTTLATTEAGLEAFAAAADRFPTTEEGLKALFVRPEDVAEENWTGPYLKDAPRDAWGKALEYKSPGQNGREFDLSSAGRDQKHGTADDLVVTHENYGAGERLAAR